MELVLGTKHLPYLARSKTQNRSVDCLKSVEALGYVTRANVLLAPLLLAHQIGPRRANHQRSQLAKLKILGIISLLE